MNPWIERVRKLLLEWLRGWDVLNGAYYHRAESFLPADKRRYVWVYTTRNGRWWRLQ